MHEVVNGLADSDAVLGIVPCGRGNDLARALGLSSDVEDVVNSLVHGVDRAIDLGKWVADFLRLLRVWVSIQRWRKGCGIRGLVFSHGL